MSSGFLKTTAPGASRAAANQTVPRNGIAYPAVATPPLLQGKGIMQLKIDTMLDPGSDKKAIEDYLNIPVNTRKQTFAEAVEEVMELFPELSNELAIPQTWVLLQESLSGENVGAMTEHILRLSKSVNAVFMSHTPYPNVTDDHRPDKPFTIPQSERSQTLSLELYEAIDKKAKQLYAEVRGGNNGAKTELGNLLRYDKEQDSYKGYMLGVLIMDGHVFATCSGGASAGFKTIAQSLGMQYVRSVMDVDEAREIVAKEIGKQSFGTGEEKNIVKERVGEKEVKTGATGTCAAPKLIWSVIEGGGLKLHPTTMRHASMTERWVSPLNENSTVPIIDAHGKVREYGSGEIVPSCKACQHLMQGLEKRLHERLAESHKFKLYREEEMSPENIEKKRVAKEQKEAMDKEYNSATLNEFSTEVQELNLAITNLLETIIKGDDSILKEELSFLKSGTDRLEELRFDLQAFAKIPLGNNREAVVAASEKLKDGKGVIAAMVDGISAYWKKAAETKPAEEKQTKASSQKGNKKSRKK
ncbi:hypothetical protein [Chitinophaga sp. OAE865]|uniref:hypothetical protein n=1 Tax=Chitinophaga sp. OAE865 TaxID=2817898 RepID=UPI001AE23189